MPELVAPEDLPSFVPGTILSRSDGLDWNGVALRSYAYKGQDVEVPAMRDFMLVSYQVGVTPMERRFDGRWTQTTCGPGAVSLPGDLDLDGQVAIGDLLLLFGLWGVCPEPCPPGCGGDLDHDCQVGIAELLTMLSSWTPPAS